MFADKPERHGASQDVRSLCTVFRAMTKNMRTSTILDPIDEIEANADRVSWTSSGSRMKVRRVSPNAFRQMNAECDSK